MKKERVISVLLLLLFVMYNSEPVVVSWQRLDHFDPNQCAEKLFFLANGALSILFKKQQQSVMNKNNHLIHSWSRKQD